MTKTLNEHNAHDHDRQSFPMPVQSWHTLYAGTNTLELLWVNRFIKIGNECND